MPIKFVIFDHVIIDKEGKVEPLGKVAISPDKVCCVRSQWDIHEVVVQKVSSILFLNGVATNVAGEVAEVAEKLWESSIA